MFTVALVGGDGAGKTTIAKKLVESSPIPCKYIYMGLSPISSNHALPTTRLAGFLRKRAVKNEIKKSGKSPPEVVSLHDLHYRSVNRGVIWKTMRMLNRLVDTLYRELISRHYQRQGYVVIYDRHLTFEITTGVVKPQLSKKFSLAQLENWLLDTFYPKPSLVIFLDAPPKVLFKRKGEATLEHLEERRKIILEHGKHMANFVRVDATKPLHEVFEEVTCQIFTFYQSRRSQVVVEPHSYDQENKFQDSGNR